MPKCEKCQQEIEHPISVVVKFWGGREIRVLICYVCADELILFLKEH